MSNRFKEILKSHQRAPDHIKRLLTIYRMKTSETRRLATANTLTMALQVKARAAPDMEVNSRVRKKIPNLPASY